MKRIKTTMTTILLCLIGCLSFPITARADDTLISWSKSTYSGGHKDLYSGWFAWDYYDNITVTMTGSNDSNDYITVTLENTEGNVLKTICSRAYRSFSGSINPMTFASSGSVRIHAYAHNVDYTNTTITGHRNSHTHMYTSTTDNSNIRSNATTSAVATYWNKCSCGEFATSGSDYHTVGEPLVSYTSGVPATKTYNKGDKVTLTANFANAASYQWYKNGVSMGSSYRSATLDLGVQNTLSLSGTNYKCIATGYNGNTGLNAATTATSTVCTLSANQTSFVPKIVYNDRNGQPRSDLTVITTYS